MITTLRRLTLDDRGSSLIEYVMMASLIAVAALVSLGLFGQNVGALAELVALSTAF